MQNWKQINQWLFPWYLAKLWLHTDANILTISSYKSQYTRTESLHQLFDSLGLKYTIINFYPKNFIVRILRAILALLKSIRKYDVVLLHFRWYELFIPTWIICKLFWKKLITDHFVSIRDTLCFDRKLFTPHWFIWKFLKSYDQIMLKLSDFTLIDTKTHQEYFIKELSCNPWKIWYLYVWCNTDMFYPISVEKPKDHYRVFWYGSVLPLQWIDIILKAAKLCESNPNIKFTLVWPIRKKYQHLIDQLNLTNTTYIDRISYTELPTEICRSHLCLGWHFSKIEKWKRVIAGKSFQFIACGVPTILWENQANRELYNEVDTIYYIKHNNETELSETILQLYTNTWK